MDVDLTSVRAKLAWAAHHFELLHTAIEEWFEPPGQLTVTVETDLAKKRYAVVYNEPRTKPLEWSLVAGDFLNNARSALDHLVCQVVVSEDGRPRRHHAFPIALCEPWWIKNVSNRNPERGPGPLGGIDQKGRAWKLIEDAQPYKGRNKADAESTAFARLARLNNTDKHRELNVSTVNMADRFSLSVNATYRFLGGYLPPTGTVIEANKEFGWLSLALIGVKKADININLPVQVAFDGVPISGLREIFEEVKRLVVAFENLGGA